MTRRLLPALVIFSLAIFGAAPFGFAQGFKVEKFDIKGEGGTDYVAVESATAFPLVSMNSRRVTLP